MKIDAVGIVQLITALGLGGVLQSIFGYFKDRKKNVSEVNKTDIETKLASFNTIIERLDLEAKRSAAERDRLEDELRAERLAFQDEIRIEQERNTALRRRIRELEDEVDSVRKSARETQQRCEDLAARLKQLLDNASEKS